MALNLVARTRIESAHAETMDGFFNFVLRETQDFKPSEVREYLEFNYGLGEFWEDWWREDDSEEWT